MTTNTPEPGDPRLPRFSIVTPSFNQARFLGQSIRSVLDQDYANLEYIIIDGGSDDGSVDIIREFGKHLHFWCSEPDAGHYAAINKGFEHATGDIFAWLNSDDMYCPGALAAVASVFREFPEVHWLSTLHQWVLDPDGRRTYQRDMPGYSRAAFLDGLYLGETGCALGHIQQESTFWRRSLWEQSGGLDETIGLAADFDLWCRFYRFQALYGVAVPLGGFRWHAANRSADRGAYRAEAENSLDRLRAELGWPGQGRVFRLIDGACRIPGVRGVVRRLVARVRNRYVAENLHHADEGAGVVWNKRAVRF